MTRVLIWGTDDLFNWLMPHYMRQVSVGAMEITAIAVLTNAEPQFMDLSGAPADANTNFERVILSTKNYLITRMKDLERRGLPRKILIDGKVFGVVGFDFQTFLDKGVVQGHLPSKNIVDTTFTIYPRTYFGPGFAVTFGTKSAIAGASIDGDGVIEIGNYTQISWNVEFEMDLAVAHRYKNEGHDYHSVAIFDPIHFCFPNPKKPIPIEKRKPCRILIGNDVWIGRGCRFKVTDPDRPLVIGDGAVVASDSVVVKSVEPYTIVGGNPARFIKYRFGVDVIEGLQRIRWWDWSAEKIHDAYKYFDNPRKFVALFDR